MSRSDSPLGQAWHQHAEGQNQNAVDQFAKITQQSPEDMDALYGLGLAQRGAGQTAEALATFQRVKALVEAAVPESEEATNRLEMLSRMVNQQIQFLEGGEQA